MQRLCAKLPLSAFSWILHIQRGGRTIDALRAGRNSNPRGLRPTKVPASVTIRPLRPYESPWLHRRTRQRSTLLSSSACRQSGPAPTAKTGTDGRGRRGYHHPTGSRDRPAGVRPPQMGICAPWAPDTSRPHLHARAETVAELKVFAQAFADVAASSRRTSSSSAGRSVSPRGASSPSAWRTDRRRWLR
jgi:hypothetical protein